MSKNILFEPGHGGTATLDTFVNGVINAAFAAVKL